jgi:hypothetical protein
LVYTTAAALWTYLVVRAVAADLHVPSHYTVALELIAPALVIACWLWLRTIEGTARKKLEDAVYSLKDQIITQDSPGEGQLELVVAAIVAKKKQLRVGEQKAKRRVEYHWDAYATKHDARAGSNLLGAVIDQPARWIEDIWTGRR